MLAMKCPLSALSNHDDLKQTMTLCTFHSLSPQDIEASVQKPCLKMLRRELEMWVCSSDWEGHTPAHLGLPPRCCRHCREGAFPKLALMIFKGFQIPKTLSKGELWYQECGRF